MEAAIIIRLSHNLNEWISLRQVNAEMNVMLIPAKNMHLLCQEFKKKWNKRQIIMDPKIKYMEVAHLANDFY